MNVTKSNMEKAHRVIEDLNLVDPELVMVSASQYGATIQIEPLAWVVRRFPMPPTRRGAAQNYHAYAEMHGITFCSCGPARAWAILEEET